jgi:hypothetical protein
MSMTKKKNMVTQEEIDKFLKHVSNNSNKSSQEKLLKLLQEMRIILEGPTFEDSIDGTRIRVIYATEISRKGGGGAGGDQEDNTVRFSYIKEIPIDYGKVPINFRSNANPSAISVNDITTINDDINENPITESYDILEENCPTLHEILGLLKRTYFMPEDFSNRLSVDRMHKLRNIFNKDEILTFPSVSLYDKAGLIPI